MRACVRAADNQAVDCSVEVVEAVHSATVIVTDAGPFERGLLYVDVPLAFRAVVAREGFGNEAEVEIAVGAGNVTTEPVQLQVCAVFLLRECWSPCCSTQML